MIGLALWLACVPVEITFGGDVALGRSGKEIAGALAMSGELAVVNLEGVLWDGAFDREGGAIRLVAPTRSVTRLVDAGIDVVGLANNHALDAGLAGLAGTSRVLSAAEIDGVNIEPVVKTVRGLRIGFVALTDRRNATAIASELGHIAYVPSRKLVSAMAARAREARELRVDVVVVLVHWGVEHAPGPNARQRAAARAAIDAGADVIVGSGPHVTQAVERYRDGVVFYSLGNLLFDMRGDSGAIAVVRVGFAGLVDYAVQTRPEQ